MEWETIQSLFEWEGSLRDIYVLGTTLETWQRFVEVVRLGSYPFFFSVDGQAQVLPNEVREIFERRAEMGPLLTLFVGGIHLNCHFFTEEEIELDLDPREVTGAEQAEELWAFMRTLGTALNREVRLTYENMPHPPLVRFDPTSGWVE